MPILLTSSGGSGKSKDDMLKALKGRKRALICIDPIYNTVADKKSKNSSWEEFMAQVKEGKSILYDTINEYISQALGDLDLISKEAGLKEVTIVQAESSGAYHVGGIGKQDMLEWVMGSHHFEWVPEQAGWFKDGLEWAGKVTGTGPKIYEPEKASDAVMAEIASKCDTIYVSGGKPNFDLKAPFWDVVKDRVKKGELLYIGRSCGSIMAGNWQHAKADPECKEGRAGLALINALVVPHAGDEGENKNAPKDKGKHLRIKDGSVEYIP